jgi:hypothetical protein
MAVMRASEWNRPECVELKCYTKCPVTLCEYFRILFLRTFRQNRHMNTGPILNRYEAMERN